MVPQRDRPLLGLVVLQTDRLLPEPVVLRMDRLRPEVEVPRTGCRLPARERPEQRLPGRERQEQCLPEGEQGKHCRLGGEQGKHCLLAREQGKHCLPAPDPPRMRHRLQAREPQARPFPAKGRQAQVGELPEAMDQEEERVSQWQARQRDFQCLLRPRERAGRAFLRLSRKQAWKLRYRFQTPRKLVRRTVHRGPRQWALRLLPGSQRNLLGRRAFRRRLRAGWSHLPRQWRRVATEQAAGGSRVDPPNRPICDPSATTPWSSRPFLFGQRNERRHSACHDNKAESSRCRDHIHGETSTPSPPRRRAWGW